MTEREVTLPSWDLQGTGEANTKQIVILGVGVGGEHGPVGRTGHRPGGQKECLLQVLLRGGERQGRRRDRVTLPTW